MKRAIKAVGSGGPWRHCCTVRCLLTPDQTPRRWGLGLGERKKPPQKPHTHCVLCPFVDMNVIQKYKCSSRSSLDGTKTIRNERRFPGTQALPKTGEHRPSGQPPQKPARRAERPSGATWPDSSGRLRHVRQSSRKDFQRKSQCQASVSTNSKMRLEG